MKRFAISILAVVMVCLCVNSTWADDVGDLNAEDAILAQRIQGFQRLIAEANIRRAEIQGVLKWLAQKEAEIGAEKIKETELDK